MGPRDKLLFSTAPDWRECSTCRDIRTDISTYYDLTLNRLRQSYDGGCTFCSLLLTGISLFLPDLRSEAPFRVSRGYGKRVEILAPSKRKYIANGIEELLFKFPNDVHLPVTSFSVDRHFVDYSDRETLQRVTRLIDKCNDEHDCLQGRLPKLPKRVIDVGNDSTHTLRLYCATKDEKAPYTVLSHCWGGVSPFLTLACNLEDRKRGFDVGELPKTFRDAVTLTRALGIRYLWLDSICIIQQDKEDWDSEGQKMADYYANAYVTIAASRAANSCAGFLHLTDRRRLSTINCLSNGIQFDCIISDPHRQATPSIGAPNCEEWNPLYTRAWAFQEMVLSPRVISFGAKEMEWYCRRHNWCECSYLMPDEVTAGSAHSLHWRYSREGLLRPDYQEWMNMVTEFTRRQLTFTSDTLPAIAGLAARFNETLKAPYLAGIWKTDPFIWEAIKWTTTGFAETLHPNPRPPSWSWASIVGTISYDSIASGCDGVTLLAAETRLRGSNPYGEVTGGSLCVRGCLLKMQLDIMPTAPRSTWTTELSHSWTLLPTGSESLRELEGIVYREEAIGESIRFLPDTPLELASDAESSRLPTEKSYRRSSRPVGSAIEPMSGLVYCLRFLQRPYRGFSDKSTTSVWLLALGCVDEGTQTYERLGVVYLETVEGNRQFFLEMEPQELTIV